MRPGPLLLAALLAAPRARADGAFPDPQQILLPAGHPEQVVLATNFGLLLSEDEGQSWLFSCEQALNAYASPYVLGAPAPERLFAIAWGAGLAFSDDGSCSWRAAGGSLTEVMPYALAIDPTDAQRVYAIGVPRDDFRGGESLYVSEDGGLSFGDPVFTAPEHSALLTVMVAPSQPSTVFASLFTAPENHPSLLRSTDFGAHWQVVADLVDSLGENPFELLAVDPSDENRLQVRLLGADSEALAQRDDGGLSFVTKLSIPGKLRAFLRLASGTILVGGTAGTDAAGYRSTDGGQSYEPWAGAPRVHALAERAGKLYVAADNFLDGYAIAVSTDEGRQLTPLTSFSQVRAVKACVADACAESCAYHAGIKLWPAAVCGPEPSPEPTQASAAGASGTDSEPGQPSAGQAAQPEKPAARAAPAAGVGAGCACSFAPSPRLPWVSALLLLGLASRRRRPLEQ
jgi:MYXO-CTERM domain-containing protein